jgi:hypothetical protein
LEGPLSMEAIRLMVDNIGRKLQAVIVQAVATDVTHTLQMYSSSSIFVHSGLAMMKLDHG